MTEFLQQRTCVICGSSSQITKEHAISRSLFPDDYFDKPRKTLITVPTCKNCNGGYSKDEELFRTFLVTCTAEASSVADGLLRGKVKRAMTKAPGKAANLLKNMQHGSLKLPSGQVIPRAVLSISEKDWEGHHRVIEKYVKCLFFHYFGKTISNDFIMKHAFYQDFSLLPKEITGSLRWNLDHRNVYAYSYAWVEGTLQSVWVFVFYDAAIFLVIVAAEHELSLLP